MVSTLITTEDELVSIRDVWDRIVRLDPATDTPFYSWDWFYRSWLHFGKPNGKELAVVLADHDDGFCGILPLVSGQRKTSGITYKTLEFCNAGMTPRNTAYCRPDVAACAFESLRDRLFAERKRWDMLELANVPESSPFHHFLLGDHPKTSHAMIRTQGFIAPYVEFNGNLDDYFATLGKSTRKDLRQHWRRFNELGDACQVRFFDTPECMEEGLEQLLDVHRRSWKGEFSTDHYPNFFKEISETLSKRGEVLIAVASLDGVPFVAGFVLVGSDRYFTLVNDHDAKYREHAPGMMLYLHELLYMAKSGRTIYDLCGTTYDYKSRLADKTNNHSTFQIFHGGVKSRFLYSAKTYWLPKLRKFRGQPEPTDLIETRKRYY